MIIIIIVNVKFATVPCVFKNVVITLRPTLSDDIQMLKTYSSIKLSLDDLTPGKF